MEVLTKLLSFFATPECFSLEAFFSADCLVQVGYSIFSYLMICLAATVKLPQILRIISARTTAGLSETSVTVEVLASLFLISYNLKLHNPVKTWADSLAIVSQNATILVCCWLFAPKPSVRTAFNRLMVLALYVFVVFFATSEYYPHSLEFVLALAPAPVVLIGKIPQILDNMRSRDTGVLSVTSYSMLFFGMSLRVATSFFVLKNLNLTLLYGILSVVNGIILFQILYYGSWKRKSLKGSLLTTGFLDAQTKIFQHKHKSY